MSSVVLGRLRSIAAALVHVPGVEADLATADGSRHRVGLDPSVAALCAREFATAVSESLSTESLRPLTRIPVLGGRLPTEVSWRIDPGVVVVERGRRWRCTEGSQATEFLLTELDAEQAVVLAESTLDGVLPGHEWCLSARRDHELGVTVLSCRWPDGLGEDEVYAVERAFRDLGVMCRVRSNLAEEPPLPSGA